MKPTTWRVAALLLIFAAIVFVCFQLTLHNQDTFGITFTVPKDAPGQILVTTVAPHSEAAAKGIRPGDRIAYGDTALERARVIYATPGSHVTVRVNGSRDVTLVAHAGPREFQLGTLAIRLAFLLVAGLLAWRRPEDRAARVLVVFLTCYGLAIAMSYGVLATPMLSFIVLQLGSVFMFLIGTGAAAEFAAVFPSGTARPLPRRLATTCEVLVAITLLLVVLELLPRSGNVVSLVSLGLRAAFTTIGLLVIATLIFAYVQGEPAERPRRKWLFFILGFGLLAPIVDVVVQLFFGLQQWVDALTQIPLGFLPIGLAYIILRHRVIDVGFVLSRALVYTGVSLCIVGIFVVVETLLAKYVETFGHVESTAVQLVVALALGFSIRFIHARVDRIVDTVLFRERHEAETALRNFAHDAPYVTDANVLLNRCVDVVSHNAGASSAGVWLREDDGTYRERAGTLENAPVDENDPAAVAMRARRVVVDLHAVESALPGAFAFPMIVRGTLAGMLVCGPKTEEETYAPDERDALAAVASAVGQALDGLRIAELERTVDRLLQSPGATQGAMGTF